MKFTPGPWEATRGVCSHAVMVQQAGDPDALPIIDVRLGTPRKTNLRNIISAEEAEANTRLVAAAPELLDALHDLDCVIDFDPDHAIHLARQLEIEDPARVIEALDKARKAIAKATGGSA